MSFFFGGGDKKLSVKFGDDRDLDLRTVFLRGRLTIAACTARFVDIR